MIISDKQMKHLPKGQLPGRNLIQKRQTTYFSFLGEPAEKDFIYFFFFFLLSEKLLRHSPRLFSYLRYSYFSNNFFYISSKRVLHMVTQSRKFCGILIPELRKTKKHAT